MVFRLTGDDTQIYLTKDNARNWYSVPYAYAGTVVDLRVGSDTLEVWHKGSRLCTHRLLPATAANRYSTNETDLPGKAGWRQWDRERCERWAKRVGPDCADVVGRLFAAQRFDDQGVEPALAVLRLSRRYSERRLENACSLALQSVASPRYSHIRPILETGQDMTGGLTETSDEGAWWRLLREHGQVSAMIIDSETKRKLREMNAAELLDAFERLDERTVMPLNHAEVVGLAVDNAYGGYTDAKIQRLVKRAGLRYPQADLRTIDLAEERGLDRGVLAGLDAGNYLGQRLNVAFQGATGSGKSFLLCALVKSACRGRYRACYIRMPDLAEQVAAAALKPGGPAKLVRKYSTYTLLAIDEWLVDKPDEQFRRFLLELMELRYDNASTAFATQLATKEGPSRLGGDTIADAILDRIVHNTVWIDTGEFNMRQRHGQSMLES